MSGKRDLAKDLELCEKATPPPWEAKKTEYIDGGWILINRRVLGPAFYSNAPSDTPQGAQADADLDFAAEAREGWPEAIRRAMEAEARLKAAEDQAAQMRAVLKLCKQFIEKTHSHGIGGAGGMLTFLGKIEEALR